MPFVAGRMAAAQHHARRGSDSGSTVGRRSSIISGMESTNIIDAVDVNPFAISTGATNFLSKFEVVGGKEREIDWLRVKIKAQMEHEVESLLLRKLPLNFFIRFLETERAKERTKRELFFFGIFVIIFLITFVGDLSSAYTYYITRAIRDSVTEQSIPVYPPELEPYYDKGFNRGVLEIDDIYQWLERILIPEIWREPSGVPNINYVSGSTVGVGALRIRTLRVAYSTCETRLEWSNSSGTFEEVVCHLEFNDGPTYTGTIGPIPFRTCELQQKVGGLFQDYPCEGNWIDIPFTSTLDEAQAAVNALRTDNFLDQFATRFVIAEFFTYTPPQNTYTGVQLFYELTAGGSIIPQQKYRNFKVWTTNNLPFLIFEALLYAFIIYYCYRFYYEGAHYKTGTWMQYITRLWSLVDLLNLVSFWTALIIRIIYYSKCVGNLDQIKIPQFMYPNALVEIQELVQLAKNFTAMNIALTFLRILKFLDVYDQFGILIRTLEGTQTHIVGLAFLFGITLMSYAISGSLLFGNTLEGFRTFPQAMITLGRYLLGERIGGGSYEELKRSNPGAAIYYWSFIILAYFLLLNFVIAFVSEGFSQENRKIARDDLHVALARSMILLRRKKLAGIKGFLREWALTMKDLFPFCGHIARMDLILQQLRAFRQKCVQKTKRMAERKGIELDDHDLLKYSNVRISRKNLIKVVRTDNITTGLNNITERQTQVIVIEYIDDVWLDGVITYTADISNAHEEIAKARSKILRENLFAVLAPIFPVREEMNGMESDDDTNDSSTGGSERSSSCFGLSLGGVTGISDDVFQSVNEILPSADPAMSNIAVAQNIDLALHEMDESAQLSNELLDMIDKKLEIFINTIEKKIMYKSFDRNL